MFVLQSLLFGSLLLLVALYANFLWKRRRLNELARKLPGSNGLPFIGILHKFAFRSYRHYLSVLCEIPDGNSLTKFWMGPFLSVIINSPENLQIVLNSPKCQKKPEAFYNVWSATEGMVLSHGSLWKRHRKILSSAFTVNVLHRLLPMFHEKSKKSIEVLRKHVNQGEFDVYENVAACSLETLMKGNFNYDRDYQTEPQNAKLLMTVEEGREHMMKRTFQIWNNYEPIFKLSRELYKNVNRVIGYIRKTADDVVEEHKNNISKVNFDDDDCSRKALINLLTEPKNNLSPREINDEICTFIIAGHETTAVSIASVLLMLAMHKDVQAKVIEEIDSVVGINDRMEDYETLYKLTYIEMVIKETMRLFPVLPVVAREVTDDLEIDGCIIPQGTVLAIFSYGIHRSKKYWGADAELFRPSRFEPQNMENIHQYAYIPFTGGPRLCIGWRYAMVLMKVYLANFFSKYTVDTRLKYDEITLSLAPSITIDQKHMITIKDRET